MISFENFLRYINNTAINAEMDIFRRSQSDEYYNLTNRTNDAVIRAYSHGSRIQPELIALTHLLWQLIMDYTRMRTRDHNNFLMGVDEHLRFSPFRDELLTENHYLLLYPKGSSYLNRFVDSLRWFITYSRGNWNEWGYGRFLTLENGNNNPHYILSNRECRHDPDILIAACYEDFVEDDNDFLNQLIRGYSRHGAPIDVIYFLGLERDKSETLELSHQLYLHSRDLILEKSIKTVFCVEK